MTVGKQELLAWLECLERVYSENRQRLTELDSAIGDADHGINMDRGFTAVKTAQASDAAPDIPTLLKTVATVLIRTVGGAAGPLYGTFFLRAGTACTGKARLEAGDVVGMFGAGIEGVGQRGKAVPGDKTMIDALLPALTAMRVGLDGGWDLAAILSEAVTAAEAGMLSTLPMQARKVRASYLGPRSVGHQDPGATSAYLLLKTAASAFR